MTIAEESTKHPHEPEIAPQLDADGRCLICGILVERDRARFLARNLFPMIPTEVWRESGGDDGQGHYEGDYHAEQIATEIKGWDV